MSDRVKDVFMVCVMLKAPFWPMTKAGANAAAKAPAAPAVAKAVQPVKARAVKAVAQAQ